MYAIRGLNVYSVRLEHRIYFRRNFTLFGHFARKLSFRLFFWGWLPGTIVLKNIGNSRDDVFVFACKIAIGLQIHNELHLGIRMFCMCDEWLE